MTSEDVREVFPIQGSQASPAFKDFRAQPVRTDASDTEEYAPKASSVRDSAPSSPEQPISEDPEEVVAKMPREPLHPENQADPATVEKVSSPKISAPSTPTSSTSPKIGQPTPPAKG